MKYKQDEQYKKLEGLGGRQHRQHKKLTIYDQ